MKNLKFIQNLLLKTVGTGIVLYAIIALCLGNKTHFYSALLGGTFSFLSFRHLAYSQSKIIKTGETKYVFIMMLLRLFIYGVPISLGLFFSSYLKLWVILIFLLSFQVSYVAWELGANIKRNKKRQR